MGQHILMVLAGIALKDRNKDYSMYSRTQPQGARVTIKEQGTDADEIKYSPVLSRIKCNGEYTVTIKLGIFRTIINVCKKCVEKGIIRDIIGCALDFGLDDARLYYKSIDGVIGRNDLPKMAIIRFFLRGGLEVTREFPLVWVS